MSGGDVSPTAIRYEGPFKVTAPATIMYRVRDDSVKINLAPRNSGGKDGSPWSAPKTATFAEDAFASSSNLRITEIHYNPPSATTAELAALGSESLNNDSFEFIEVGNISDDPINLGGTKFVLVNAYDNQEGIEFTFADQDARSLASASLSWKMSPRFAPVLARTFALRKDPPAVRTRPTANTVGS